MDRITQLQDEIQQLLTIMSSSIAYLTSRANFKQVGPDVPITKQRKPDKVDAAELFEANKKELVTDLVVKAKQVDYLIQSLPEPEAEKAQAHRLQALEDEMTRVNEDYLLAVNRASASHSLLIHTAEFVFVESLHQQISAVLRTMLDEPELPDDMPYIPV
ncbi:hypothetical protein WOLCODRAFT_134943 [Wolfiporia cocos MD-104 SS10]|uniref:Mediator of RNA polymerase II transcription subunit 21 n=1 Tax=Wolfiporia cocos (strain MD-104) TaxID=742152 RepID=A0A2H3JB03_WOLCO|nr:hypothetical protein WOLCODRAFT_134943 [Wolfiporia cocos MD-104 SS10]